MFPLAYSLVVLFASIQLNDAFRLPKVSNDTEDNVNLKIVNGQITNHHVFPFMVELFSKVNENAYTTCGGSIVNP